MFHKYSLIALLLGYLLDLLIGDPRWMWHPIRAIGALIASLEKVIRGGKTEAEPSDRPKGVLLVILVVIISTIVPGAIVFAAYWLNPYLGLAIEAWFCYWILATRSLKDESMKVAHALKQEGLEAGRYAVSMIVGRDTAALSEEGVVKAAVEKAENRNEVLLYESREKAESIIRKAKAEVERTKADAEEEMRKEIVDVSTALSEQVLGREINMDDHRSLIDTFIDNLEDM